MFKLGKLISKLNFDVGDDRFELLEKERGDLKSAIGRRETPPDKENPGAETVSSSIDENERMLKDAFHSSVNSDLILRRFKTGGGFRALLAYMNGMASDERISRYIISPLMNCAETVGGDFARILEDAVEISEADIESDLREVKAAISDGKTALFVDGTCAAILLETRGYEKRSVTEAQNERIVLGPKEGFSESLRTNITLLRRIIKTEDLVAEYSMIGGENKTRVALSYRSGFTDASLIGEVKRRLGRIRTDIVMGTGIIDQLIEDDSVFPIPRTLSTERPDRAASHIMNGGVAVFVEGSPFALVMPITLSSLMNSPEDVYMRRPLGTLLRVVRYIGAAVSIVLPGYFIALAMYHQGLLSTEVLSTVIKSREMVFEPLPFEMLLLLFVFQLIREAGMRVPGSIGQAIGVIGGLILGQAAVAANLASTVILIIVALSGLGNLCIPDYSTQVGTSYLRVAFLLAAWAGGLLGLCSAIMLFIAYMANVKSFGVPFLSPFSPKTFTKSRPVFRGRIGLTDAPRDFLNTGRDEALN